MRWRQSPQRLHRGDCHCRRFRLPAHPPARNRQALEAVRESGSPEFGYEVQYLLHAQEAALGPLKQVLAGLGVTQQRLMDRMGASP